MADDVQQEMVECFDGSKTIAGCEKLDGTGSMGGLATPEKSAGQVNMEAESVLVPDGTSMDVPEQVMRVEGSSSDVVEPLTPATDKSPSESGRVTPASQSDQSAYLSSSEKSTTSHKSKITDPPTRQIEFDAASTSSGSVKNEGSKKVPQRQGLQCRKGEKIEAMDYLHQWFPAKIRAVNEGDAKVLVHYDGWNQRYDEWITMNSDRIRPLIRHSKRKEKSKRVKTDHMIGDQVYAKWTDCKMYPAKITNILPSGSYEVIFYDGFKKLVQPINVRSMPGGSKREDQADPALAGGDISVAGVGKSGPAILPPKAFVVEQDHNPYKCHFEGCNKSFRKAHLLDYHIKYYHMTEGDPPLPPKKKRRKTTSTCSTESEQGTSCFKKSAVKKNRNLSTEGALYQHTVKLEVPDGAAPPTTQVDRGYCDQFAMLQGAGTPGSRTIYTRMLAAVTPGSVDGTQNEKYYLRLHLLHMEAGKVLRATFDSIVKPNNLLTELRNHKRVINKLHKDGVISRDQYRLLNPNPDSQRFDVSLLIVLLRNISNLQPNNPIWKENDNNKITNYMHPIISNIVRIRNLRNKMQHKNIAYLEQKEFEKNGSLLENAMVTLCQSCGLNDVKADIAELMTKTLDVVTPEMKNLRETTLWFFEESCRDKFYVETARFQEAIRLLKEKHFIVLTGLPGEGKTAMAARLALADGTKPENCLTLHHARDWRKIDWSLKLFNTVIVDDIFGGGALNQKRVADWIPYLPEMERAAKQKRLRIIITTRHYIKEEALEEMDKLIMFDDKDGYVLLLSSKRHLTFNEKKEILMSRAKKNNSEHMIDTYRIRYEDCVRNAEEVMNLEQGQRNDLVFGFPQFAELFVRSEELIKLGSVFFSKPEIHFKTYIDQLYKGKDPEQFHKFLALVAVWAEQHMTMKELDLQNADKVSDHVKNVAKCFGIDVNNPFLETLKSSLKRHVHDLLLLIDHSGEYTFSHNVNGDMVGVVLGSHKLLECIELCPRDFLMERVTIEPTREDELRVVVPKKYYDALCEKFAKMIGRQNCNLVANEPPHNEFQQLQRKGPRPNTVDVLNGIDFGILKHSALKDEGFVKQFIRYIREKNLDQDLFTVPVMKLTGYFLDYGIKMTEMVLYLPGYTLYSGLSVLAKELLEQDIFPKDQVDPLLFATHSGDIGMMKLLLSHGAKVSGDTIFVAVHKRGNMFEANQVLDTIFEYQGIDINDKGNAVNGNYPLIVAARKGFTYAVKCMLQHGADPSVKNDKNMTALHKAVIYKHAYIIKLLIDHNSPLDAKGGTFKRTTLHIAADLGMSETVKHLMKKGANVKIKDTFGLYPIFLAAIRGHYDTVSILLKHDKSQDSLRIVPSGKRCFIKGMSLMHVAVWKNDRKLIQMLIDGNANPNVKDFFGQTPLLYAIMTGKKTATRLLQYADKTVPQTQGYTPLHAAIIKGNFKLVAKLAAEVNINDVDKYGRTPLHVACEKGDINVVNLLLKKHNADPLIITNQGDTVFHILRQTEKKRSHEEHCKRRLIEMLLLEAHPAIFDRVKSMPNNKGVYITDGLKLASKDLITINVLKQAINCDFDEISDDEDDDAGAKAFSTRVALAGSTDNLRSLQDLLNIQLSENYSDEDDDDEGDSEYGMDFGGDDDLFDNDDDGDS
ncbi:uncharacterized protein LOC128243320 isoform X2 [Mya arenaria]|nr:uncharacterized protein LOC128243320 isoform X2 [Mya arenaria]